MGRSPNKIIMLLLHVFTKMSTTCDLPVALTLGPMQFYKNFECPGHVANDVTMVKMLWKVRQVNIYTRADLCCNAP